MLNFWNTDPHAFPVYIPSELIERFGLTKWESTMKLTQYNGMIPRTKDTNQALIWRSTDRWVQTVSTTTRTKGMENIGLYSLHEALTTATTKDLIIPISRKSYDLFLRRPDLTPINFATKFTW